MSPDGYARGRWQSQSSSLPRCRGDMRGAMRMTTRLTTAPFPRCIVNSCYGETKTVLVTSIFVYPLCAQHEQMVKEQNPNIVWQAAEPWIQPDHHDLQIGSG